MQYDPSGSVGQAFGWGMQTEDIYDPDKSTNALDIYHHTDHRVQLQFTSFGLGTGYYRMVDRIGLVYG